MKLLEKIFGEKIKAEVRMLTPRQNLGEIEVSREEALIEFESAIGLPLGTIDVNDPNLRVNLTEDGFLRSVSYPIHLELTKQKNGRYIGRWMKNDKIGNDSGIGEQTKQNRD